jgi:hypothetical protein
MTRPRSFVAVLLVGTMGCATAAPTLSRPIASDVRIGAMGERTRFELVDTTEPEAPADEPTRPERRRKSLFWTGLALAGIGTLGVIGFGVGGRVAQKQIADGYDDGTLTRSEEDTLTGRGELFNGLAIGSAVVGLLGVGVAAIVYGIDRTRCGQLKPRRTTCSSADDDEMLAADPRGKGDNNDDDEAEAEAEAEADADAE